jgi:hypothetical protein
MTLLGNKDKSIDEWVENAFFFEPHLALFHQLKESYAI